MYAYIKAHRRHRRQQSAPSSEQCAIAVQAFRAARLLLRKQVKSVEAASARCGSNVALAQAAVTLCLGDPTLQARVVRGGFPLLEVPRQVRRISASTANLVVMGRAA
jgi:hypothetical protein